VKPGQKTYARIVLREPALLVPRDRFIIRMFSPVVTIGGGEVLDTAAIRYRRTDDVPARLSILAAGELPDRVALLVREASYGVSFRDLVARLGLMPAELEKAAAPGRFAVVRSPPPWLIDAEWFQARTRRMVDAVREFHRTQPLAPGIAKQDLRSRELPESPPFLIDALLEAAKEIVVEGENVRLRSHKLVLKQDEEQARGAIERAFEQSGLAVPGVAEVLAKSGVETARARPLLQILLREKKLVRVNEEFVFHHTAIRKLREIVAGHRAERFNVAAFKDWTGISRKYAIPLLEYLDREHVTRREGDERLVL
jgi:selenocysteine-specific elongation factor